MFFKPLKPLHYGILAFASLCTFCFATPAKKSHKANKLLNQPQVVADRLHWIVSDNCYNNCGGYFFQPLQLKKYPNPLPAGQLPTDIESHGPAKFMRNGMSKLTGGVVVTQPGRRITADTAFVYRDAKTNKVSALTLIGNVHFQQYQRLIVAMYAHMDMRARTILLKQALYHVGPAEVHDKLNQNIKLNYDAWGASKTIMNPSHDIMNLTDTTYSTCSPLNQVWKISASHLHFDRDQGIGMAKNMVLRVKHVPVAYFPYAWFPIDNRRQNGFLFPDLSISKKRGSKIGVPIYWNMAPNYDMTVTPYYNFKRGFELDDLFRYITTKGKGKLQFNYLPYDRDFKSYRRDTINEYQNNNDLTTFIEKLRKMHDYRGYLGFNGEEQWSDSWHSYFHLNYVTDPYFFRDISAKAYFYNPNQLLNEVTLSYSGAHWDLLAMVEAYQTLHPIDQFDQPIYDQYQRLPELDATAFYPNIWRDFSWHWDSQAVNFNYDSAFPTKNNTQPTPIGQRLHLRPSIEYNHIWRGGYFDPQFYLDTTSYITQFKQTTESSTRNDFTRTRVLPIINVNTGLYFERRFGFRQTPYIQTLEPRLFYLYVPYQNQDAYPNFDTELLPFSYNQLFSVNRFSDYDRLDNANQVSLGLSSRILNSGSGQQKLRADFGVIYYIQDPKVSLSDVTLVHKTWSPLVGNLNYSLTDAISLSGAMAWDAYNGHMNNASARVNYRPSYDSSKVFTLGYQYVRADGQNLVGISNTTNQIFGGISWPLWYQWSGFGYAEYSFSGHYPENYFAGLQYDSCCWALRFIFNRHFTGRSPSSTSSNVMNQYDNVYYVQLQLKGLGSVGNNSASSLLESRLPGYHDPFANSF